MSIPRDLKVKIPGRGHGQDQRRLRDRRAAQDRRDDQAAVPGRDGRGLPDQQRDQRQLRRLPARGQLRRRRLRRRRPPLLQRQHHGRARRGLRDDRRPARLPEAQGPGRARLRPLPPRRQRLLPRLAPAGLPAPDLPPGRRPRSCSTSSKRKELAHIFGRYFEVDKSFVKASNLIGAGQDRACSWPASKAPVNEVPLPGLRGQEPGDRQLPLRQGLRPAQDRRRVHDRQGLLEPAPARRHDAGRTPRRPRSRPSASATSRPRSPGLEQARPRARTWPCWPRARASSGSRSTSRRCARPARATPTPSRASTTIRDGAGQAAQGLPARALRGRLRRVLRRPGDEPGATRRSSTTPTARARSTAAS